MLQSLLKLSDTWHERQKLPLSNTQIPIAGSTQTYSMILCVNFHFTEKFVFTIENGNVKYFRLANGHGWQVTLIPSLII